MYNRTCGTGKKKETESLKIDEKFIINRKHSRKRTCRLQESNLAHIPESKWIRIYLRNSMLMHGIKMFDGVHIVVSR